MEMGDWCRVCSNRMAPPRLDEMLISNCAPLPPLTKPAEKEKIGLTS